MTTFVGIDVSKAQLDVALRPSGERMRVANSEEGIAELIASLSRSAPTLVVVEATGGYQAALVASLAIEKLPTAVVNPRQVRDFAKATGQLAKTDAIDADVLAHFGEVLRPEPKPLPDEQTLALEALITRRRQQEDLLRTAKGVGRMTVATLFAELPELGKLDRKHAFAPPASLRSSRSPRACASC